MKKITNKFGERLKTARKDAGLSRKSVADSLGTTHASIARWETEGVPIPSTALETISRLTGRPIEYFVLENHKLSETKIQSAVKLAEIIDIKDSQIDELKAQVTKLKALVDKDFDQMDKNLVDAIEGLKEKKDVG